MLVFLGNVIVNGTNEIIDYLMSLGGSPLLNGDSWDPSSFNLTRIIQLAPSNGVLFLLGYDLQSIYRNDVDKNFERLNSTSLHYIFKGLSWNRNEVNKFNLVQRRDPERRIYTQYKDMMFEMIEFYKRNSTYRNTLEAKIDKAIEGLKVLDEVNRRLISHMA